ncbi:MAG TPA: non-ribosomal peptide synthetase [Candidatus Dormibacteraeota bacterium]|nr:non-ribosomal peptide synthetase [Candidatus Dormibacteraeota bacterium]
MVNFLSWFSRTVMPSQATCMPLLTNPVFDASLKQLFAPLLRGAWVWIPEPEALADPRRLLSEIAARPNVAVNCAPALWEALLNSSEAARKPPAEEGRIVSLILGGDRLYSRQVERSRMALPAVPIWNVYGPTETTSIAIAGMVEPGEDPPIGRPIANVEAYVLDARRRLVPTGVPGELYLGGAGLARGYRGQPELTGERFVDHPFRPGRRLYRTGDRVRRRQDGRLEFLGRLDEQIKLRGYRIEPAEVEAVLRAHPQVLEAVVVAREERLVAYLVAREPAPEPGELRGYAAEQLPAYMVPAAWQLLRELPRTRHGKLDRRRLPEPEPVRVSGEGARTATELAVAEIWQELLGRSEVGRQDNFFDLGGRSLLLVRLQGRLQERFGRRLSVLDLFRYPTVAAQADHLDNGSLPELEIPIEAVAQHVG